RFWFLDWPARRKIIGAAGAAEGTPARRPYARTMGIARRHSDASDSLIGGDGGHHGGRVAARVGAHGAGRALRLAPSGFALRAHRSVRRKIRKYGADVPLRSPDYRALLVCGPPTRVEAR